MLEFSAACDEEGRQGLRGQAEVQTWILSVASKYGLHIWWMVTYPCQLKPSELCLEASQCLSGLGTEVTILPSLGIWPILIYSL